MEIEHRKYIIERLDKIDVTEVLIELRTALRKGLLDKAPVEVEYKERFISKLTANQFINERQRVYYEYDSYCDKTIPLLMELENMTPRERIVNGAETMYELFILDGKRRSIGVAYNDLGSIGIRTENKLKKLNEVGIKLSEQQIIFRTILLPDLPYDVDFQKDIWYFMSGACGEDVDKFVYNNGRDLAEKHTRGSIMTLSRKIQPVIKNANLAKKMYERIQKAYQNNLSQKQETIESLTEREYNHIKETLEIFHQLAYYNCVEDLKRRICLDRFEEYLLRKSMAEALYSLDFIKENSPFCMPQEQLCNLVLEKKNGIC